MWTVDQLVEILSKNDQWKIEQTDQTIIIRNQDGVSAYVALVARANFGGSTFISNGDGY